jgi:hypothetical protein
MSNEEIINNIQSAFNKEYNFKKVYIKNYISCIFFIIQFTTEETKKEYIQKTHPILKTPIYNYETHIVDEYVKNLFESQDANVIKVLDVPYNYDIKLLIQKLANVTKKAIKSYKELKKQPRNYNNRGNQQRNARINPSSQNRRNNRYNQSHNQNNQKSPKYKKVIVKFEDKSAVDYILSKSEWGITIEDFFVRIIPGNTNHEEYVRRTSNFYKITGLPLNTDINE